MMSVVWSRAIHLLDAAWANLWQACWQGGLVVLAVWIILRVFRSMPARCQCWFWRLAMAKFVAVLWIPTLLNLPLLPPPPAAVVRAETASPAVTAMPIVKSHDLAAVPTGTTARFNSRVLWYCGWLIGVGCFCIRLLLGWHNARRLRGRSHTITDEAILEQLQIQTRLFHLRRPPRLVEVSGGGSPMLIGILRPALIIPAATRRQLNHAEQTMVLGHELAHIRRRDLFWNLLASLVRSLFFFHPLVWLAERQLKLAQEVAADELAVTRQKSDPLGYGNLLVSVVAKLGPKKGFRPLVSTVSLETAGPVHSLTRRLVAMARIGQTSRRVVWSSGVVLLLLVMVGIVPWRLVAAEPKVNEKQPQHLYRATVRINEQKTGQPEEQLQAPAITYPAGQSAVVAYNCHFGGKDHRVVVMVGTSSEGQPAEHAMQVLEIDRPNGKELPQGEVERLLKNAEKRFLEIDSQHAPKDFLKGSFSFSESSTNSDGLVSGFAFQIDGPARMASQPSEPNNGVAWESPKVIFGSDTPGEVKLVGNDGAELKISVAVSPAEKPASTLSDYEALPNPTDAQFFRKPYRMDLNSYGIVVSNDLKGRTRVAGVNKATGEWKWLDMPKNDLILFEPIAGDDVAAFMLHGSPLSQLVVYNGRLNKWSIFPLQERVIDAIPCVGDRIVGYQLSDRVVVYSAEKDAWGMLLTEATLAIGDYSAFVDTPKGRYAFPGKDNTWSAVPSDSVAYNEPQSGSTR